MIVNSAIDFISDLVRCGGPDPHQYQQVASAFDALHKKQFAITDGMSSRVQHSSEFSSLMQENWRVFRTTSTMQGFAFVKPNGYAGDYEIIERIYNKSASLDADLHKWDTFWHANPAAVAVRNRSFFVSEMVQRFRPSTLLSVGCGPGLDVRGLSCSADSLSKVILLDNDKRATDRARANQLVNKGVEVEFETRNALRLHYRECIDLVWCSGLFDYLSDKTAVFILNRFREALSKRGKIIVGNFSHDNPSRAYMETVGEWFLIHRSRNDMERLAHQAGFEKSEVLQDDTGVNLFLICE